MLASIHTHDVDFADLYFQYSRFESWSLEEGIVKSGAFNIDRGVGVRAVHGDKQAFAYSDDISLAALDEAAVAARAIGRQGQSAVARARPRRRGARALCAAGSGRLAAGGGQGRAARAARAMARARDPRVVQVMASLAGEYEAMLDRAQRRPDRRRRAAARARVAHGDRRGERPARAGLLRAAAGASTTATSPTRCSTRYATQAVGQALLNLGARDAPAGTMTVVLGHGWPGILLHEAIGHGLEGDFNRKGTSAFSGRVGQRVAAQGHHRRRRRHDRRGGAARSTSTTRAIRRSAPC